MKDNDISLNTTKFHDTLHLTKCLNITKKQNYDIKENVIKFYKPQYYTDNASAFYKTPHFKKHSFMKDISLMPNFRELFYKTS